MQHPIATLKLGHRATATLATGHAARAQLRFVDSPSGILRFEAAPAQGGGELEIKWDAPVTRGPALIESHGFYGSSKGAFGLASKSLTTTIVGIKTSMGGGGALDDIDLTTEGTTPAVLENLGSFSYPHYSINSDCLAHSGSLPLPAFNAYSGGGFRLEKQPQVLPASEDEDGGDQEGGQE